MEIIKILNKNFYILFSFFVLLSCKTHNGDKNNVSKQIQVSENSLFEQQKLIERRDNDFFKYTQDIFELKTNDDFSQNLKINNKEYNTKLMLDSSEINLQYFKQNNDKIILLEGNDYYASVFFIYYYNQENLYYLGNFSIDSPNIETDPNSGIVNFQIEKNNKNEIIISSIIKNKVSKVYTFKSNQNKLSEISNMSETIKKWQGIYYYSPFDDKDSIGNYYIDIDSENTVYSYSGGDGDFQYQKSNILEKNDTLYITNPKVSTSILAKLYKKNNLFFVKSELIKDRKLKNNNQTGEYNFKYAKSADDVVTYHIYANGTIEKHIPKKIKSGYEDKYKYVYHDKNDTEHEICIVEWHRTTKKLPSKTKLYSKPTHSKIISDKNIDEGQTKRRVIYENEDISLFYAHLKNVKPFTKGQIVEAGTILGETGVSGVKKKDGTIGTKAPHLHFEIRNSGTKKRINPGYFISFKNYDTQSKQEKEEQKKVAEDKYTAGLIGDGNVKFK